ncbi:MAG: exonuclease subunit SbcD, partial [Planctomycetaceae bacterium]|nr:exonuclease subunit SbcD [Planctomycetaceae bacterium]
MPIFQSCSDNILFPKSKLIWLKKYTMRIIHTSDWHLGQTWDRRNRYEEFAKFLDWMLQTVREQNADVLIVAGDIFDNQTPSPTAQTLYYDFLRRMLQTGCQTVIIAGNHDSPQLIDAPGGLLTTLQIHVIGEPNIEKELIEIKQEGKTKLLVAAVPFMRDRNLRQVEVGESAESREQKSLEGLKQYYLDVCNRAEDRRRSLNGEDNIPLIATGHLFVQGGKTSKGVRELYVGTLGDVGADIFPPNIDYVALGHLHVPQKVAGSDFIRYSGSSIP